MSQDDMAESVEYPGHSSSFTDTIPEAYPFLVDFDKSIVQEEIETVQVADYTLKHI